MSEVTAKLVYKWLKSRKIKFVNLIDIEITNGVVHFTRRQIWGGANLRGFPFKIGSVSEILLLSRATIDDLSFLPKVILDGPQKKSRLLVDDIEMLGRDYIPILLMQVNEIIVQGSTDDQIGRESFTEAVEEILNSDRVDGKIPRNLIPTKINQLRALDEGYDE